MLLSSLGTSVANVALPVLARELDATFQAVQWIVLAYLLATTTLIVTVGRLGDITGRRRLLLGGIGVFTAASVLCGAAPTLWLLIVARAAQGLGAATMMSLAVAFVGDTVPKAQTGSAMGLLGTTSAIGTALGPSLGGVLIASSGWRAIFFGIVPLGGAAFLFAYRHLPTDGRASGRDGTRFDTVGTLLLALTLAAYALAMTIGHGRFGTTNVVLLSTAFVGVGVFIVAEARVPEPLVRIAMFRGSTLSAGLAMTTLVSTVMMATLVVGPFYLSLGLRLDTALVGIVMSAGPTVAALTGVPAGRLVDRFGAQPMTVVGLGALLVGFVLLSVSSTNVGLVGYVVSMVVTTAGYAVFQAANNTAVMTDIHAEQRGLVSSLLNLSRNLGLITGASAMGAVFTIASGTSDIAQAKPGAAATGMSVTFAAATILVLVALVVHFARRGAWAMASRMARRPKPNI